MRSHPLGQNAAIIGEVVEDHPGMVTMHSVVGGERVVTMLAGEQLPQDLLTLTNKLSRSLELSLSWHESCC